MPLWKERAIQCQVYGAALAYMAELRRDEGRYLGAVLFQNLSRAYYRDARTWMGIET